MANSLNDKQNQALTQVLLNEVSCTEHMLKALETEAEALGTHEPEKLELASKAKQETMLRLEAAGKQREHLIQAFAVMQEGKPAFYASDADNNDPAKPLNILWNKLITLAEKCQQLNRVNGSVIERGYQNSRHALDILQGLSAPGNPMAGAINSAYDGYNQNGQTTYSNRSRPIAQV